MGSLGPALECICTPSTPWVFLSAGERQSKALMKKAKMHARACNIVIDEIGSEFEAEDGTIYNVLEIHFPNGSWIAGLPANPDTARGYSANILLDEFALHKDSKEIWAAMAPTILRGYKVQILSTFKGKENKFFDLFENAPTLQKFVGAQVETVGDKGGWSKHFIPIESAIEMGLDLKDENGEQADIEDLKLAINDEEIWAEEFDLEPSDEQGNYLTYELISSVENQKIIMVPEWVEELLAVGKEHHGHFKRTEGQYKPLPTYLLEKMRLPEKMYVGFDVARHRDFSVIWIDADTGGKLKAVAVITMKKTPFHVQRVALHTILKHPGLVRACIDKTGIGEDIGESAHDLVGDKAELIDFSIENKSHMATGLKKNLENGMSEIPANSIIRSSFHSVKRSASGTGHFRFDAEKTEKTGHADHFWAKALSTQAAGKPIPGIPEITLGKSFGGNFN